MSRATFFGVLFVSLLFIYLVPQYYPVSAGFFDHHPSLKFHWQLSIIYVPILWGLYAAFSVLNAVRNVKDYPESKHELLDDIQKAKEQLSKAGFDWN